MFNKTVCKSAVLKKTVILTTIASLFLVGCGNDQNYKREVDGNEKYLNSPILKPLVIPKGVTIPAESADYHIYSTQLEGAVGKQVDIRPPMLPIATITDAYATYEHGVVTLNAPADNGVWNHIPTTLSQKNIPISSSDRNIIQTAKAVIVRDDEPQTAQASFIFHRQIAGGAETITLSLNSLTLGSKDLSSDPIKVQRYVVSLFNAIMMDVAPPSARVPPAKDKNDAKDEESKLDDTKNDN